MRGGDGRAPARTIAGVAVVAITIPHIENPGEGWAKLLHPAKAPHTAENKAAEAILHAATEWHVNPAYLWGIYGVETGFGADIAISSTGAKGPFQFEPATAAEYGYPVGVNEHGPVTDWTAFRKQAGAAAHYLAAHGGAKNIQAAVRSYNPGEASYLGKVTQAAKSFSHPIAGEAASQKEAETVNAASSKGTGLVGEIFAALSTFALRGVLLAAGAVLLIYGIMVAVRPRERAFSIPLPVS